MTKSPYPRRPLPPLKDCLFKVFNCFLLTDSPIFFNINMMQFLFYILLTISPFVEDTLLICNAEWVVLNFPLISACQVYVNGNSYKEFQIKGDTLFLNKIEEKDTILIVYKKLRLRKSYKRHKISKGDVVEDEKKEGDEKKREDFSGLRISGIKRFGIVMEEGISLDQSTEIRVGGQVGNRVKIEGVLSDRGVVSGEEYTTALEELEQLYLKAESDNMKFQIGDFLSENLNRITRIEGVSAYLSSESSTFEGVYGFEKGVYNSVSFYAIEGFQGPYSLSGKNGQEDISIVSGTEKVYLNGELLKQGKDADYIINYREATITFTPKRLLTSRDRITIDFQYRSDEWKRKLGRVSLLKEVRNNEVKVLYMERGVDIRDLSYSLSQSDLEFLHILGDSVGGNEISGATYVGEGLGDYIKEGDNFVFVGEGNGDYKVYFTYVGEGNGSYAFENSIGGFEYVGEGMGNYLPIIRMNPPDRLRYLKISDGGGFGGITYNFDLDISDYDANVLSPRDDIDNRGYGYRGNVVWNGDFLGRIQLNTSYIYRNARFTSPHREFEPDLLYEWLQIEEAGKIKENSQFKLTYSPHKSLTFNGEWGFLRQGKNLTLKRGGAISFKYKLKTKIFIKELNFNNSILRRGGGDFTIPLRKHIVSVGVFKERGDTINTDEYWAELFLNFCVPLYAKIKERNAVNKSRFLEMRSSFNLSAVSYDFAYDYVWKEDEETYNFLSLSWRYTPENMTLWGSHFLNSDRMEKKEERYIYVGEGKGEFSYDPVTGVFVPDPFGDYVKEIVSHKLGEGAVLADNILGFRYNPEKMSIMITCDFKKKNNDFTSIMDMKEFISRSISVRTDFSLNPSLFFITPSFGTDYSIEEDEELGRTRKTEAIFQGELTFPIKRKLLRGGLGGEIRESRDEIQTFLKVDSEVERYLKLTLSIFNGQLSAKLGEEKNLVKIQNVSEGEGYSVYFEPSYTGRIKRFLFRAKFRLMYGGMSGYSLFPSIPEGFGIYYTLNVSKNIKRDLKFRFDWRGRRGRKLLTRERLSLSLELQF